MQFEVTAAGFDGRTDQTDNRIFWVSAPNEESVKSAIEGLDASVDQLWDKIHDKEINFFLPGDEQGLKDKCLHFYNLERRASNLFPIERSLEYRIKQRFIVSAKSFDEAAAKVAEFVDSDWSCESAKNYGLVQVSDELEQIENSQEINYGDDVLTSDDDCQVDESMQNLLIENRAPKMLALLRKISSSPAVHQGSTSDLGVEVKAFVDSIDAELAIPGNALKDLAQSLIASDDKGGAQ